MASIVRYRPLGATFASATRTVDALDRAFERLFTDSFGPMRSWPAGAPRPQVTANLFETEAAYWVELPLPGVKPEDLDVSVRENTLTVKAKRSWTAPENARTVWQGFGPGEWEQSFTLPGEVDAEKVEATFEHGVLRLELPKAERLRPRTIRVNAGAEENLPLRSGNDGEGQASEAKVSEVEPSA